MLEALQHNQRSNQSPPKKVAAPPAMSNMQTVAVTPRGYTPPSVPDQSAYVYQPQQDPKKKIFGKLLVTVIVGSAVGIAIGLGVVISQNGGIVAFWNKISPFNKTTAKVPFYFLADSAFAQEHIEKAEIRVKKLKEAGYKDAGMFLISDYPNLGDSQWQQVYAEKFSKLDDCKAKLGDPLKLADDAYCAFASPNKTDLVQRFTRDDLQSTPSPSVTPSKAATPTPTITPSPTQTASPIEQAKPSADEFVRDYYNLINRRELQTAWKNLSPEFQNGQAQGYGEFKKWWQSVDRVSVNGSQVIEMKKDSAVVEIQLTYQIKGKVTSETQRLNLIWNKKLEQWQIDKTSN
jgi:hypothetical protein